jgi:hypothetical protein
MLIILPGTVIPIAAMYLNVDPTVHIINHIFEALPIFPYVLKSIFGFLLPIGILLLRYIIMLPVLYEMLRTFILVVMIIMLSVAQFQDAFDFLDQFFLKLKNSERQMSLQHVSKYRQIFIIRDTYRISLSFGLFSGLTGVMISTVFINYCVIKMYDTLPASLLIMLVYLVLVEMFTLSSAMKEGAAVENSSIRLLRTFKKGTAGLQSTQLKYVTKTLRSLHAFSFPGGVPGFNFFTFGNTTRRNVLQFVIDYTINMLLTF